MGTIVKKEEQYIHTRDGQVVVRRVTTVRCPNGKLRHPVDYFDATPGAVKVSEKELEYMRVPVYKQLI